MCWTPHTLVRQRHGGVRGEPSRVFGTLGVGVDPVLSRPLLPDGTLRTHGCRCFLRTACHRDRHVKDSPSLSSRVKQGAVCSPQAHDHPHRSTAGRAAGDARYRGCTKRWLAIDGGCLKISRRRVTGGMAPLACRKPKWRIFMKPWGRTCWRNLRINSRASRVVVRRRALPGLR